MSPEKKPLTREDSMPSTEMLPEAIQIAEDRLEEALGKLKDSGALEELPIPGDIMDAFEDRPKEISRYAEGLLAMFAAVPTGVGTLMVQAKELMASADVSNSQNFTTVLGLTTLVLVAVAIERLTGPESSGEEENAEG